MRRFLFLLSSFYIGNPKYYKHKKYENKIKNGPWQHKTWQKITTKNNNKKIKNTKIKIKCVWRGGGGSSLFALSDLQHTATVGTIFLASTTVLRHRLLLQTTCYNHLRLLLHLDSSSKEKQKQQHASHPPPPPP